MSNKKIIVSLVGILFAILLVSMLWKMPLLLAVSLCLLAYIKHYATPVHHELDMFIIVGIIGPTTESIIMRSGAWSYASTDIFNFPIWLPFLWGLAGTLFATIYEAISTKTK